MKIKEFAARLVILFRGLMVAHLGVTLICAFLVGPAADMWMPVSKRIVEKGLDLTGNKKQGA